MRWILPLLAGQAAEGTNKCKQKHDKTEPLNMSVAMGRPFDRRLQLLTVGACICVECVGAFVPAAASIRHNIRWAQHSACPMGDWLGDQQKPLLRLRCLHTAAHERDEEGMLAELASVLRPNEAGNVHAASAEAPNRSGSYDATATRLALQEVFEGMDPDELISRQPALLQMDPRVVSDRVQSLRSLFYGVPIRVIATRALGLVCLDHMEVRRRLDLVRQEIPKGDARRVCRKAMWLLLQEDPRPTVLRTLQAIRRELPTVDAGKVLVSNPVLLAHPSCSASIRERKDLLAHFGAIDPVRLIIASPWLLSTRLDKLHQRLIALKDGLNTNDNTSGALAADDSSGTHVTARSAEAAAAKAVSAVLQGAPRVLAREASDITHALDSLCAALADLDVGKLAELVLVEPKLVLLATETDVRARVRGWEEDFGPLVEVLPVFVRNPKLLMLSAEEVRERIVALERGLRSDGPVPPALDRAALLRKAPMLLLEDPALLHQRASALRQVLGPDVARALVRSFPRLLLKDFQRNLLPKGKQLAKAFPPHTVETLLRDAPQLFFYSTSSIQRKVTLLEKALPGMNVTAMMTRFPGLACLDVAHNVELKVLYLTKLWDAADDRMTMAHHIECDPRVLSYGFGRLSRAGHVAKQRRAGPAEAIEAISMRWEEMERCHPRYVRELRRLAAAERGCDGNGVTEQAAGSLAGEVEAALRVQRRSAEILELTELEGLRGARLKEALLRGARQCSEEGRGQGDSLGGAAPSSHGVDGAEQQFERKKDRRRGASGKKRSRSASMQQSNGAVSTKQSSGVLDESAPTVMDRDEGGDDRYEGVDAGARWREALGGSRGYVIPLSKGFLSQQ